MFVCDGMLIRPKKYIKKQQESGVQKKNHAGFYVIVCSNTSSPCLCLSEYNLYVKAILKLLEEDSESPLFFIRIISQ